MIYGDWEDGYEQLPVLFNAIEAVNPGMHYEYIPKPNAWKDGRQIFFCAFWCFFSVSMPLGSVVPSSPLMVRS